MEEKVKEYAERLVKRYDEEEWYKEMTLEAFVRNEYETAAKSYHDIVRSLEKEEKDAVETFVTYCYYLLKV